MSVFFVLLGVAIALISLTFFVIGRASGLTTAKKILPECNERKIVEGKRESTITLLSVLAWFTLFFGALWPSTFTDLRQAYIKNYENGKYVWVQKNSVYTTKDNTTFHQKNESYLITKRDFEKRQRMGDISAEE